MRDGADRPRDLGSAELWQRSLARSRQRRRLLELNRRHRRRRKTISVAMSASMAGGPILAPAVAAAEGGHGTAASAVDATAGVQAGSSKVVLELGSQGALVGAAQRRLNEVLPFSHLAVDGIYGPLTRAAVVDFQRRHGLPADGRLDVGTWARLFDAPVLVFGASDEPLSAHAGGARAAASDASRSHSGVTELASLRHSHHDTARSRAAARQSASSRSGRGSVGGRGGETPAVEGASQSFSAAGGSAGGGSGGGGTSISVVAPPAPSTQTATYVLTNGVALPLPRQYITNGYVDQGVDYAAPGGTPEYAMGDGVIIGEGISGFGPNAPILKITSGPLKGLDVYYGHAGPNLVHVGDHVKAGQQITEVGYGIVGISTGPHLEIGFYPPGPRGSGSKMLAVINALLRQHPTGRAWGSTSTTAHVAHDTTTRTTSTNSIAFTVPAPQASSPSGSGGAAVASGATPDATPVVSDAASPSPTSQVTAATPTTPSSTPTTPATTTTTPATVPAAATQPSVTSTAVPTPTEPTATTPTATAAPAPTPAEPAPTTSAQATTSATPVAPAATETGANAGTASTLAATAPATADQSASATDAGATADATSTADAPAALAPTPATAAPAEAAATSAGSAPTSP
jgi:murein DD-endopeptidase MepM/ murein hydrolase activator NlpD